MTSKQDVIVWGGLEKRNPITIPNTIFKTESMIQMEYVRH